MRVPDEIRKCVCFVGYRKANGTERVAGTAFFIGRFLADLPDGTSLRGGYAVTARHIIDEIRNLGLRDVLLRVNLKDENRAVWVDTNIDEWQTHPTDDTADVAVLSFLLPERHDHLLYPLESAAARTDIDKFGVGPGSEVFVTGLFAHHLGQRNLPIIRVGNLAALPEDKITTNSAR